MKPLFDVRCERCEHTFEERKEFNDESGPCPRCGSESTHTLLSGGLAHRPAKDPYDLIGPGASIPSSKKIKSFGNDRRSGGKDIT
jgi:putative FmdB family regulatory protein